MLLVHHNALAAAASNEAQVSPRFHQVSENILPTEEVKIFNISPTQQVQHIPPPMLSNEQYPTYGMDYSSQAHQQQQQSYQLPRFFNPYMTFKTEQIDERPPSNEQTDYQQYAILSSPMDLKQPRDEIQYTNLAIKQEGNSDILDMDAQKSVYPPNYGYFNPEQLPPVSSIYQGINWMPQHPPPMHFTINENYQSNEMFSQIEEAKDYGLDALNRQQYVTSQVNTSPSLLEELPMVVPVPKKTAKENTWQSNETRKPKTYNCTSCCKWFTSSGHLKRHFSTTLHQNAVRLSGQPDPALLPTSTHHHPNQQTTQPVFKVPENQQAGPSFNHQPNFYQPNPEQNVEMHQQPNQFSPNQPQPVYYNSSFESVAPNRCDSSSLTSFEDDENEIPNDMNTQQGMINYPQQIIFQENQMIPTNQHRCVECDKVFNKSCYLTQHNRSFHNGLKPFKCQRCGKKFASIEELDIHFAKHNGDKPFKCEVCPKQFHHKTDLRRHMCTHNGKPFSCEICGKGFIRNDHMLKHTEIHRRKSAQNLNKESKNGKVLKRNLLG